MSFSDFYVVIISLRLQVVRERTSCPREIPRKNKHVMRKAINTTKLAVDQCIAYLCAASIANHMKQSNAPPGNKKLQPLSPRHANFTLRDSLLTAKLSKFLSNGELLNSKTRIILCGIIYYIH